MLVVEIDGGYHDQTIDEDLRRQHHLQKLGWTVVRFTDHDVEKNAEAVGRAIAKELNVTYEFKKRGAMGSGSKSVKAAKFQFCTFPWLSGERCQEREQAS